MSCRYFAEAVTNWNTHRKDLTMTNKQTKAEFKETFPDVKLSRERDGIEPMPSNIPDGVWFGAVVILALVTFVIGQMYGVWYEIFSWAFGFGG